MYVKINGAKDYVKGNSQSCKDLVDYLEKENEEKDFALQERFFDQSQKNIDPQYVISKLDNNKKGLKEKDAKFYMLSVNPSEKELKHLAKLASGKDITHISQLADKELEKYNDLLKDYTRAIMDEYAKNFNRGLTGNDLVYFGKVEQQRYWNGIDARQSKEITQLKGEGHSLSQILEMEKYKNLKESEKYNLKHFYENGAVKQDDLKPGLQTHVHIVVSRKDITQKHSLSPHANSRGSDKHQLNGKNVTVGFDRNSFVNTCEIQFDKMYSYNREYQNTYAYHKFSSNPLAGVQQASRLAAQSVNNPEMAGKNMAIIGIDKITNTQIASQLNTVSNLTQNPDSAKDLLVNQLDKVVSQLLPPEVKVAKKVVEKVIKPIVELGSGGLEI
jgi:hypothetical protein